MAERFDFKSVYEDETWTVVMDDIEGIQDRFYRIVDKHCKRSEFPNLEVSVEDYITGGLIFNKESTKMLKIKAVNSSFNKFEIFFRAQVFGKVVVFSRMECMERSFFTVISGKTGSELKSLLRMQCANMAQYEEFVAIDSLANILYNLAMKELDPNYNLLKPVPRVA